MMRAELVKTDELISLQLNIHSIQTFRSVNRKVCMLFAEKHFVESTFLATEGAPKVRVRVK
jgi:hypothetical protein